MHQPLRGHIPQRSALSSFLLNNFISPLKQKSKSKIADVYFPRFIQQQVRRFDIAVQNAAAVGVRNRPGGLEANAGYLIRITEFTSVQTLAFYQLHRIITTSRTARGTENSDNIGMMKPGNHMRLMLKQAALGGILQQQRRQQLDGHFSIEGQLQRFKYHPHTAAA